MAEARKKVKRVVSKETRQKQKENLKVLVENSDTGKLRSAGRVIKYGAASFARNIWLSLASILVMTVTLLILLATIAASVILNGTAMSIQQKIDITLFFKPGTEYAVLENMGEMIKTDPNVTSIEIADSATEYMRFIEENRDNEALMQVLEDETMNQLMLDTIQATMRIKVQDPDNLDGLRRIVETTMLIQENLDEEKEPTYDLNRNQIAKINSWANIAKNSGLILGAIFLMISILMIFNTIRMAIFSRREEIYMMRLVGADGGFIRGPFLVEAQICGIISGLLASTLAYLAFTILKNGLFSNPDIDTNLIFEYMATNKLVLVYLVTTGVGMLIGLISARLAMQKYLK